MEREFSCKGAGLQLEIFQNEIIKTIEENQKKK